MSTPMSTVDASGQSDGVRLAYITARDQQQAAHIGRQLIEAGLAACVNVLPGMTSLYRWKGQIEEASECVLIAKTTARQMNALIAKVTQLHSYEVPCVLGLSVTEGAAPYLAWLRDNSRPIA